MQIPFRWAALRGRYYVHLVQMHGPFPNSVRVGPPLFGGLSSRAGSPSAPRSFYSFLGEAVEPLVVGAFGERNQRAHRLVSELAEAAGPRVQRESAVDAQS